MSMKSLFSLYPQLMACPLALVSWREPQGRLGWEVVEWVGVVCGRPSRLSFSLVDEGGLRAGLAQAGEFALSLPEDDRLCRLRSLCAGARGRGAALPREFTFVEDSAFDVPRLADCPVTFTCGLQEQRGSHGRLQVTGVVRHIHLQGQPYPLEGGMDVCALQPFHPRWFQGPSPLAKQIS
ncbi:flavin reductase family protein [Geoalkalibacter sp.]|uniref:flavin reductase family protein n=1 Tax=Geoalkalibacter sp. TaxID=3041440 RepID=UPI00272E412E|nr:flavin reductase family protein [Geoalkalibacter sp.]